ncbi:division/cell wall cluster transcriptional repressor MraZ [Rhizobacter sp. LjRoot28]|uniref:division/cell wall cluster transcriptional repressor MraZ n=1 Tax=Rhizobacter sp. LjRoot28 TaxID=3342309 RepID=UPI003E66CC18
MADFRFQGQSALTLDAKGRVTVPARQRDVLLAEAGPQLTLTKSPAGCLFVFPRPVWNTFRDKLIALPMSADGWKRIFLGSAMDVDIDASSRVLISPELRAAARLTKDVVLIGMGSRLELWNADAYAEQEAKVLESEMPDALKDFQG